MISVERVREAVADMVRTSGHLDGDPPALVTDVVVIAEVVQADGGAQVWFASGGPDGQPVAPWRVYGLLRWAQADAEIPGADED